MQIVNPSSDIIKTFRRKGFGLQVHSNCVKDGSGRSRTVGYARSLGYRSVDCFGLIDPLEGELRIVDDIDVNQGTPSVTLINVAPRNCESLSDGQNGTPFVFTRIRRQIVVSTLQDQVTFSLLKKVGLKSASTILDTEKALRAMYKTEFIRKGAIEFCQNSQFRSLWYAILVGAYIASGEGLEGKRLPEFTPLPLSIISIDAFGNSKSNVLPHEVGFTQGGGVELFGRQFPCYQRLTDIPKGELGICIGSSGFNQHRFLEVVKNGGSAADELQLEVGSKWE